jgi:hypothetical protein
MFNKHTHVHTALGDLCLKNAHHIFCRCLFAIPADSGDGVARLGYGWATLSRWLNSRCLAKTLWSSIASGGYTGNTVNGSFNRLHAQLEQLALHQCDCEQTFASHSAFRSRGGVEFLCKQKSMGLAKFKQIAMDPYHCRAYAFGVRRHVRSVEVARNGAVVSVDGPDIVPGARTRSAACCNATWQLVCNLQL